MIIAVGAEKALDRIQRLFVTNTPSSWPGQEASSWWGRAVRCPQGQERGKDTTPALSSDPALLRKFEPAQVSRKKAATRGEQTGLLFVDQTCF